jgi:hypothetical protein
LISDWIKSDTILGPSQRWLDSSSSLRKDGSIPEALATSSYSSESHPGLLQTISSSCNASDDDNNTTTIPLDDQPRYFIPGINGKARCLHSSHQELQYGRNSPSINHSTTTTTQDTRFKHLLKSNETSSKSHSFSSIYNLSSSSLALEKLHIHKDKDEEHEDSKNYLSSSHSKGIMFHGNTSLTLTTSASTSVAYSTSTTDNQEDSIRSLDLHFQLMNPKPECKFPFLEQNYQPTANKRRTKKNQNEPKHENQQELEDQKETKHNVDDKRQDRKKKRKKKTSKELLSDYLCENDRQFSSEKEKSKHRTLRRSTQLKTKKMETQKVKIDEPIPKSQNRQRSSSNHERRKPQKKRDPTSKLVQFRQSLASQSRRSVDDFDLVDRMYVARRRHASYQETTSKKQNDTQEAPPLRSFQSMVDRSHPTRPDIAPTPRSNLCDVMDIGYQSEEVLGSLRKRESQLDLPTNMTSSPMTKETHSPNTLGSLHFISVERTKTWDKASSDVQSLTQTFHNSILKQYSQPLRNPPNVSNQLTTPRFQQSSMDAEKYSPPLYQNAPTSLLPSRSKLATNKHVSPVFEEASLLLSSCLDQDFFKEKKILDNSISNSSFSSPETPLMPMDQLYRSFEKLGHQDWVATRCDTLKRLPSSAPTNMTEKNSFLTKIGQPSNPVLPSIPQISKNRPPKLRQELSHPHSDHQPREIQRMSNYKTTTIQGEDGNSKKDTSRQSRSASCPKTRNKVGFSRDVPTTSLHENRRRSQSRHGKKR